MDTITGRYRHFKGNEYIVLGVAKHSETLEEYVVYSSAKEPELLWIRPKTMFFEEITTETGKVKRFTYIED